MPSLVFTIGALLLSWGSAPVRAQLVVSPESLRVLLVQGAESAVSVTLSNSGASAVPFCLDVLRPGQQHHPAGSLGAGCGPPGERLALRTPQPGFIVGGTPLSLAMTSDGRLFVADFGTGRTTVEYTADLAYVRYFEHPRVAELSTFATTNGVTYDIGAGTLWWLNMEASGFDIRRTMLLEGTLTGAPTGRRITLQIPTGTPSAPSLVGGVLGAGMEPFYALDSGTGVTDALWALDATGAAMGGYPLALQEYPEAEEGNGLDVHGGIYGAHEVRLEVPVAFAGEPWWSRVVVTDPEGRDLGLETPIPSFPPGWRAGLRGTALRSRVDPNGVMYGAFAGFDASNLNVRGLFAFRPVPLSPSWLVLGEWSGTISVGGSTPVSLVFRAGERPPGEYSSTLVVEDTAGVVLASVPLTLVVEEATPGNEPGPGGAGMSLAVSPNPITTTATATITLAAPASDVTVTVHDVLGRQTALMHHGPLPAGDTPLALDARGLPAGVYVVRALVDGVAVAQRITVLR